MDPNTLLFEIREIVSRIATTNVNEYADLTDAVDELDDLAEKIANLDEWLSKGGFLPLDWRPATTITE